MITDPHDTLVTQFRESRSHYEIFLERIRSLITMLLSEAEICVDGIQSRVKTVESISEKLNRSEKRYSRLEELPDLAGLRIIAHHQDDVKRVVEVIRKEFDIDNEESGDSSTKLAPQEFGYLSMHLVIRLSQERHKLSEYSSLKDLHAEVQVRTILQHAWASISHALQYKHEDEVPYALRRRLYRVSALLELADEEFDCLEREHRQLTASENPETESILMILRKVLRRGRHSYDWIRAHTPYNLNDKEFDKLIQDHPKILKAVPVKSLDENGNRIRGGRPGMKLKEIRGRNRNQIFNVDNIPNK